MDTKTEIVQNVDTPLFELELLEAWETAPRRRHMEKSRVARRKVRS